MTDAELQSTLAKLSANAMRRYVQRSGEWPTEKFVQNVVADKLMDLGFVVVTELDRGEFESWFFRLPPEYSDRGFFLDLMIFNPADSGIPKNATPRAVVEFKKTVYHLPSDIERTAYLTSRFAERGHQPVAGFVVALTGYTNRADWRDGEIGYAQQEAAKYGLNAMIGEPFDDPLHGGTAHGVVMCCR
jgi:hypothetical protein